MNSNCKILIKIEKQKLFLKNIYLRRKRKMLNLLNRKREENVERVECLIERRNDWKSEMSLKDKKSKIQ